MADFVYSVWLPVFLIAITVMEAWGLHRYHRRTGRGVSLTKLLPALLAGDFLMLALALVLGHAFWGYVSLALVGALLCHTVDLFRRWQR